MMELVIFLAILIIFCVYAFPTDKQNPTSCINCLYFADNCCTNELSDYYAFNACGSSWCELGIKKPEGSE